MDQINIVFSIIGLGVLLSWGFLMGVWIWRFVDDLRDDLISWAHRKIKGEK